MKPRHTVSLDANHSAIVQYLRKFCVEVTDFAGAGTVPDLLTYHRIQGARWIEIKVPTRKSSFPARQLNFIASTMMDVMFATDAESALLFATSGVGALSQSEKDRIAVMLRKNPDKKAFTVSQVEGAINGIR